VDLETYRDVHEPWLERSDLVERTEAGRIATPKAKALYGEETLEESIPELLVDA
jgi:Holliday junction resolvasome RuvABC ATP-dependent DNA helicase subunit